jgi:hypothetical protein
LDGVEMGHKGSMGPSTMRGVSIFQIADDTLVCVLRFYWNQWSRPGSASMPQSMRHSDNDLAGRRDRSSRWTVE